MITRNFFVLLLFCSACTTPSSKSSRPDFQIASTVKVISSKNFSTEDVNRLIIQRIKDGIYDEYQVDLCIDDSTRCQGNQLSKYTKDNPLILLAKDWDSYSDQLKKEILNEITYYTWGHANNANSPLVVTSANQKSPFDYLNPKSKALWMTFPEERYIKGGKGAHAYVPNCWYSTLSAIASSKCEYANSMDLISADWSSPRFMGAAEFRCFMKKFVKVDTPQFGDVVRYYTDSTYYDESINLYNGEVHAAVYVGYDSLNKTDVVLTKNGRRDWNFLIYQDVKALDKLYAPRDKKDDPRIKGYYRLKPGASIYDPAVCKECSDCYAAYKTDSVNYSNRWNCLANKLAPGTCGKLCYCFPDQWEVYR